MAVFRFVQRSRTMYFPPLRSLNSLANPGGPRWADVQLSAQELDALLRRMVMVVGWDDTLGESKVLGSGYLVGTEPDLIAITATHVLTEWADKVRPTRRHAFSGLKGDDEDLRRRLDDLVQQNLIRAVVRCKPAGTYCMCQVGSLTFTTSPRDIDVATMTLRGAKEANAGEFEAFAVDLDPGRWDGAVLIAGFVKGSWWTPPHEGEGTFRLAQSLVMRAGYSRGRVLEPPGFRCPMYQLNMPSMAGMSGGPVLALRTPTGDLPRIISSQSGMQVTAIGIVSRDYIAPSILIDGSDAGETWAVPIEDAYLLRLRWQGRSVYFGEVVRDGRIKSYGLRARSANVLEEGADRIALSFDSPDG
jgi:hypothetical protein